ncbi:MAG: hypothetical protein K0S07_400 [Chlamydiales bacterium]|jgi:type IV pilus assembly protein PilM|nr:hypothetical protein [Chlamydiales bacterium]
MNLTSYFGNSSALAVEVLQGAVKIAQVDLQKGKIGRLELKEMPLETYSSQEIAKIQNKKDVFTSCLPAKDLFFRTMDIPLTKDREIKEALPFQAEPILPFALEDSLLESITLSKDREKSKMALFAYKKEAVQAHLEFLKEQHFEPEITSPPPIALAYFAHATSVEKEALQVVLHVGSVEMLCIIRSGKAPLAFATSDMGLNPFLEQGDWHPLCQEALRLFYACLKAAGKEQALPILLVGEGAHSPLLIAELQRTFKCEIDLPLAIEPYPREEVAKHALNIGSALVGLEVSPEVNFRSGEFSYPHPWRRLKGPMALFCLLAVFLTLLIYGDERLKIKERERSIKDTYANVLSVVGKEAAAVEQEYCKKHGILFEESLFALDALTPFEIAERVSFLQQAKTDVEAFPLFPNVPKVSDALAWLSTHSNVVQVDPTTLEKTTLLKLESFQYTLVKRPAKGKLRDHYQVKIDLEISSETPHPAREFHAALVSPNPFVDPKAEIKWTASRGKYRATFYLKDKTAYSL